MENDGSGKVQVITAGGPASAPTSSKKKKNKRRGKGNKRQEETPAVVNEQQTVTKKETEEAQFSVNKDFQIDTNATPVVSAVTTDISTTTPQSSTSLELHHQNATNSLLDALELEATERHQEDEEDDFLNAHARSNYRDDGEEQQVIDPLLQSTVDPVKMEEIYQHPQGEDSNTSELVWLFLCFIGIMASFVCYGLLLEYTTSGGRKLHELSFLFVTSALYTVTAATGRYVRAETPTTIPPARFAILGLTSMGSTFCSVRSLRYVIFPIQVLAKSCKPVPVMLFGAVMGKRYPAKKYFNVMLIVLGVALFMGGGDRKGKKHDSPDDSDDEQSSSGQIIGIALLFVSLCFDGGTGAYEDKLMSVHSVQPFDLMYNIQLGKTILAGVSLLVLNQLHIFLQMCQDMGFLLVALGLSGALGQVFIFVTIAKFGALTCSIIGLARKVTTLVASIYFYGHYLNGIQFSGLVLSVAAMVLNFWGKKKGGGGHGHGGPPKEEPSPEFQEEMQSMLDKPWDGDVELANSK